MKKLLLLIVMLLSAAASAFAVEEVEIDGLWYEVVAKAKEAKVIQYKNDVKYNGDIVIPETVVYEGVTYSVTSIGLLAFYGCSSLNSITIPNSVTSIGERAFLYCSSLTSVTIPNSVTSIGNGAFWKCSGLTSVTIPNSVTNIGIGAFQDCSGLTSVTIPNSVTSIGNFVFQNCSGLTSVTIPNSVTSIGSEAFLYCSGLTSITIPNSVTNIGIGAFRNCSGLTSVVIGSGVKYIVEKTFANCPELTDVICYAENVPSTRSDAFEGSYIEYATLHVPTASIDAYKTTVPWSDFGEIVALLSPEHKLTYYVDGEVYKTYKLNEGEAITPEPAPTKEGYSFSGWSNLPETMPAHDVDVIGTFAINTYKLTYMVDGAEYKSYDLEYGAIVPREDEPTKEGYTFSGWSEIPETMPAHDVTVTGSFTINQYTITYIIDGEVYMTESVDFNSAITPPTPPAKDGYDFAWGEYPETMPAHDITIEGSYTTGIYSIDSDDEDVEWYTLNGLRIEKPGKGTYIMRKNGVTRTVVIK